MSRDIERSEFRATVVEAVANCGGDSGLAVVFIKLASFHNVNTRYGFDVADRIIEQALIALRKLLREPLQAYRIGGTRFAFVVPNVKYAALLRIGVERALGAVRGPLQVDDHSVRLDAVAGAVMYPDDGESADELLLAAEFALLSAAEEESGIVLHAAQEQQLRQDRWQLETDLKRAMDEDQFTLQYQPQIGLQDFATSGFEALLRWKHPGSGFVSPDIFIPLAERGALINQITDWVMHTALRQTSTLPLPGTRARVSINVSPVTLFDPGFPFAIESAVSLWGGSHDQLAVEVTEGTLIQDIDVSKRVLSTLRDKGVRISIDDFGTGYSSLAYFKQLPVDEIKIDKSFITHLAETDIDRKLVESIVELGHKLDLQVVAEGVEEERALNILREIGCDVAQGFLISPALPAEDLHSWFGEGASTRVH
ncbi:GGDEF domain-containing protein [Mangrovimicrobium sediminis]|uniref:GGDEF domain-containing protein n=1 Tax=Mangrovimicrobium sediminis TaxID=2562682 RepID=A0A4Z0M0H6_9GAMM|nr:GGDEF domain-containing phosphodiesterase [Haliea sp. SAOS-164]TGD72956.1 GGDEF domain-containing protein [Haliea sp. SAOS-164]